MLVLSTAFLRCQGKRDGLISAATSMRTHPGYGKAIANPTISGRCFAPGYDTLRQTGTETQCLCSCDCAHAYKKTLLKSNPAFPPTQRCLLTQQNLLSASCKRVFLPFSLMTKTRSTAASLQSTEDNELLVLHLNLLLTATDVGTSASPVVSLLQAVPRVTRTRGVRHPIWWPLRCQAV